MSQALPVLIVEDEALIAMDLEDEVAAAGHRVVGVAGTARAAIDAAIRFRPAVVLMDLHLADGSSGEAAARRLFEASRIRCVFISGNLDAATRARLAELRPFAMLSKPIMPTELRAALAAARRELGWGNPDAMRMADGPEPARAGAALRLGPGAQRSAEN